jgi:PiT family inorganic phosphate transporter
MLSGLPADVVILIGLALIFDFLNGVHDSSNIVATMIASRAMGPRRALAIAALAEFAGPFLFGVAVAETIGSGIVDEDAVTVPVLIAAVGAAIVWNLLTWFLGIPSSASHALVGGLAGATVAAAGFDALKWGGLSKVLLSLFIAPPLGLLAGFCLMKAILFLGRGASPRINVFFKRGQWVTAIGLALSHGTNDAQKTMGLITLGLVVSGVLPEFRVPPWAIALSAGALALGTLLGGWRLIRTLGARFYTIRPVHGFTAQAASASVILGASLLGGPVSTSQVVSSSIVGAGSAERLSKVRWGVARQIGAAWLLTIPISTVLAAGLYILVP